MSIQSNREITPSTMEHDKTKKNKQWNKVGPEGKQLSEDIIQCINDGTFDLAAPRYMILYNKNPGIYGRFSKDSFRNNVKSALKDYRSAIAMGHSPTGEYHVCGAIFDNSTNFVHPFLTTYTSHQAVQFCKTMCPVIPVL